MSDLQDLLTIFSTRMLIYFEKHKIVEIVMRLMSEVALARPADPTKWLGKNIHRVAQDIYEKCRISYYSIHKNPELKLPEVPIHFYHRIVIYGRHGSGRKTQAIALAKKYNLVYVDADHLICENLKHDDAPNRAMIAKDLRDAMEDNNISGRILAVTRIIAYRLIEKDCLNHGYVLVNYPNTVKEFRYLMEKMWAIPNKIIYLDCPELIALRRLCGLPPLGRPQDNVEYFMEEMRFFKENEDKIKDYVAQRYETIYVDSTPGTDDVSRNIIHQLARVPYLLGFNQ